MPTLQAESVGEQNAVEGVAVDWYTVSRLCSETGYVNIVGSLVNTLTLVPAGTAHSKELRVVTRVRVVS